MFRHYKIFGKQVGNNYFLCLRGSFFFLWRYNLRILRYKLWLLFYCFGASGLVCYFLKIFFLLLIQNGFKTHKIVRRVVTFFSMWLLKKMNLFLTVIKFTVKLEIFPQRNFCFGYFLFPKFYCKTEFWVYLFLFYPFSKFFIVCHHLMSIKLSLHSLQFIFFTV